jgi:hypothetical protein
VTAPRAWRLTTVLLILALGACSASAAAPERVTSTANSTGEHHMTDALQRMCDLISSSPMTATDLARKLGTVTNDLGGDLQIEFRPTDARFAAGDVTRKPGTQEANAVGLTLAAGQALPLAELKAAFGPFQMGPKVHADRPDRASFHLASQPGRAFTCSIVAEVTPGAHGIDDATATKLVIVREVVLAD